MKTSSNDPASRELEHRLKIEELHRQYPRLKDIEHELLHVLSEMTLGVIGKQGPQSLEQLKQRLNVLRVERQEFLKAHGLPEDYNIPKRNCQICNDTGFREVEGGYVVCECVKQANQEQGFINAKMSPKMREQTFANFSLHYYNHDEKNGGRDSELDKAEKALKGAQEFVAGLIGGKEVKGLFFYGGAGVGKTHLVSAIANSLIEQGVIPLYLMVADLLDEIRKGYESGPARETAASLMEQAKDAPLLILDDIGAERTTDWSMEKLFQIVNHRYINRLPIVLTSNYALSDLEDLMGSGPTGQRICSRIIEMCRLYHLDAHDIRYQKRLEGHS